VSLTINPDENLHSLYLDGELAAQNTSARHSPSTLGETNQNWLGRSQYAADGYFDGRLDDFRIYDRVLTPKQIENLFNGITPVFTKALEPTPEDGAYHPNTWVNLSWKPGDFAISHDIYLVKISMMLTSVQKARSRAIKQQLLLLLVFRDFLFRMVLFQVRLTIGESMRSMTPSQTVHGKVMSGALEFRPKQPMRPYRLILLNQ
jgi:hypothetical protein